MEELLAAELSGGEAALLASEERQQKQPYEHAAGRQPDPHGSRHGTARMM